MGDPKKLRKKYATPSHPWQKSRIEEEKQLMKDYGLRNKQEVWKMHSLLKNFYREAKRLVATHTKQAEVEKTQLLNKLQNQNLIKPGSQVHDVLDITIKDIMDRRLQTILVKKSLARSVKQARQVIVHGHVSINGKKINQPSYIVQENELSQISFTPHSAFADTEHPERVQTK